MARGAVPQGWRGWPLWLRPMQAARATELPWGLAGRALSPSSFLFGLRDTDGAQHGAWCLTGLRKHLDCLVSGPWEALGSLVPSSKGYQAPRCPGSAGGRGWLAG